VADGALPEAARPVHVLLSVRVPERRSLAADEDHGLLRLADDGVRVQHVRHVEASELARLHRHSWFLTVFIVVYSSIVCGPCS
jgi:hypothetical protein